MIFLKVFSPTRLTSLQVVRNIILSQNVSLHKDTYENFVFEQQKSSAFQVRLCHSDLKNGSILSTSTSASQRSGEDGQVFWQEVYEGLLGTQVRLVKGFSLGTSVIGISVQPFVINHLGSSMSLLLSFSALIGMFTFVTPAIIHWFTKKYVFKLRHDPVTDVYSATVLTFFLRERIINFKVEDVTLPDGPAMFTTFLVKNTPLFVDMDTFKDITHYGRIMGYDKPLEIRLRELENEHKQ